MRMLFTGCVECGRSTTSVDGLCPTCEAVRTPTPQRPRDRITVQRQIRHRQHGN